MAGTIWWDAFDTPLGSFYAAVGQRGVCRTSIGGSFEAFAAPYSAGDFMRDVVKLVDVHE